MNSEMINSRSIVKPDINIADILASIDAEEIENATRYIEISAMEAHPLVMVFHDETKNTKPYDVGNKE